MGFSLWHLFKVGGRAELAKTASFSGWTCLAPESCLMDILPLYCVFLTLCSVVLIYLLPRAQAGLLMCNALLILNRRRFLSKYGLDDMNNPRGGGNTVVANNALLQQAAGLLHAVQYLKVPVIAANVLTILFEILIGG